MIDARPQRPATSSQGPSPDELRAWLEWAGAKLIAMPGPRIGPKAPSTFWPDYSQELFQVLAFRSATPLRAMAPSSVEIPLMELILSFPALCTHQATRRVLHCRALIHPVKQRHLYRWDRIAELLDTKVYTVKYWHRRGLAEVARKIPEEAAEQVTKALG